MWCRVFLEERRVWVFQVRVDLRANRAAAHLRNDETDQACLPNQERAVRGSAIQRYVSLLRDIRATS
jgi:hypothetical protein